MEINRLLTNFKSTETHDVRDTLENLTINEGLIEQYIQKSPDLSELLEKIESQFDNLDQIRLNDFRDSYLTQAFEALFKCIEKSDESTHDKLCESLIKKHLSHMQICLILKSTTKNASNLKEICLKLLTKCSSVSKQLAKQIAIHFEYFAERKTNLVKHMKTQFASLREACVRFLFSFLKYYQSDDEFIIIIKKIFFSQVQDFSYSTINGLFATLNGNSLELIEFILEGLLFKVIKNEKFSKSDKVKLFNDKNLTSLIKLYEWNQEEDESRQQLVYQMINEFLKILFCSTQFGISFYDKTFVIDGNGKNSNHLIYNSIVAIKVNPLNEQLVDELLLKVFKVCPDLLQRYFKNKLKNQDQLASVLKFGKKFFEYQKSLIKNSSPGISLTSILATTNVHNVELLSDYIINTSFIANLPFNRIYLNECLREDLLDLLTLNLSCLKEWNNRLALIETNTQEICNQINLKLFSLKSLPLLITFNISGTSQQVNDKLMKLMAMYFDLFLSNVDLFETQIDSLNFDFIQSMLKLNDENEVLDDGSFERAIVYIEFMLKYFKLNKSYAPKLDFVYKLLRLLAVYSSHRQVTCLMDHINRFIRLNLSENEYDEDNFMLFLVIFVKIFQEKANDDDKQMNFLIDFVDTTLKTLLSPTKQQNNDFKILMLNCFLGNFCEFKAKYEGSIECLVKVEQFINHYINLSTQIDANFNKSNINYNFEAAESDTKKVYEKFCSKISIKCDDYSICDHLKALNLLYLLKTHSNFDDFMLTDLSRLIATNENMQQLVLSDSFTLKNVFLNEKLTEFCCEKIVNVKNDDLIESYLQSFKKFQENYTNNAEYEDNFNGSYRFLTKITLKDDFFKSLMENSIGDDYLYKSAEYFKLLIVNKDCVLKNLSLYTTCLKKLLKVYLKHNQDKVDSNELDEFLVTLYEHKPKLFTFIVNKIIIKKKSSLTNILRGLKKFSKIFFNGVNEPQNGTNDVEMIKNQETFKYTYTLSEANQTYLIDKYKLNGNLDEFKFGYNEEFKLNNLSSIEIKTNDFINEVINDKQMQMSILKFPTTRKLNDLNENKYFFVNTFDNDKHFEDNIYDPVYILLNLYTLLDYGNFVEVSFFIRSNCLSYLIVALSSECENLRAFAYGSLFRFNQQLENSRIFCKNELLFLIQLLRNSLTRENQKIAFIVTLFISQLIPIILEPGSTLYKPIMSFLLIKPTIDLTNVPEFYKFFNSSSLEFKTERKWLLNIIRHGIRTTLEYRLYEKRFVFRQLFSIFDSKLSDSDMKYGIIETFKLACNIKHVLIDLIKRHYFLLWLTSSITNIDLSNAVANRSATNLFFGLLEIYLLIWKNLTYKSTQLPFLFLSQMFFLLRLILDKLEFMPNLASLDVSDLTQGTLVRHDHIKNIYKKSFQVSKELLECINEQMRCATYELNELDLEKFYRIKSKIKQDFQVDTEFFQLLISMSPRNLNKTHSSLYRNLNFVLDYASKNENISQIEPQKLFTWLTNCLSLLNTSDVYAESLYDDHFNVAINTIEILGNFNMSTISNELKEEFYCFIRKFQNQMDHDGVNEEKQKILNEKFNCDHYFSLIVK